jgi:hypothetical protein
MPGWSSTVGEDQTVPLGTRVVVEIRDLYVGTVWSGQQRRANTLTTTRYVGLTKDCATNYVAASGTVATVEDVNGERVDDSGQYAVVRVDITYGTWA